MVGAKPRDLVPILLGHCFISSSTNFKGPEVMGYMLKTVMWWHAKQGLVKPHTICIYTDNCAAQFKSAPALLTTKDTGMGLGVDVRQFQNVVHQVKSWSDGLGFHVKNEIELKSIGHGPKKYL